MIIHAKLCSKYWKEQVKRALNIRSDISDADFEKLRKKKTSEPIILYHLRNIMGEFKDNANTHS